jgi:hypothetical protein
MHVLELTKVCYPACSEQLDKYMEFASLLWVLVSPRGCILFDHALRSAYFNAALPFFPLLPSNVLHLVSAFVQHRRPSDDTVCKNCGSLHHTQECDLFSLVFTSDPTTPTTSRRGRERAQSTSRSRTRSRSASTARASGYRGRSTSRARSETTETRKPAANVAFAPAATEKGVCHQFKKTGSCTFGSGCRYKH